MIYTGLDNTEKVDAVYLSKRLIFSGAPPLSYPSKGYDLEDFLITGNTVQGGTPSSEAPVEVLGCGEWDEVNQSFKLPLTVNGTEYPIYLGQVSTTRKIKKMVLTGEEKWTITSNGVLRIGLSGQLRPSTPLCTHYLGSNSTAWVDVPDKSVTVSISGYLAILDTTYTAVADFKSYLQQQYAAGTPVTVWYVLANEKTGIVNEPLMKIGDCADTVSLSQSGITVPTTVGINTITTETTVLPSNISVTTPEKEVVEVYAGINYQEPIYYKSRTLTGILPLTYKGLRQPLSDYSISGNTLQGGTPSSEAPVEVLGCGEWDATTQQYKIPVISRRRSRNLFDKNNIIDGGDFYITNIVTPSVNCGVLILPCKSNTTYTVSRQGITKRFAIGFVDSIPLYENQVVSGTKSQKDAPVITSTSAPDSKYLVVYYAKHAGSDSNTPEEIQSSLDTMMVVEGDEAPATYEPYYIDTTTDIYLGQVPTTRRIKKLVLTGNEDWNENAAGTDNCFFNIVISGSISGGVAGSILCTHFVETEIFSVTSSVGIWLTGARNLRLRPDNVATLSLADFKQFLANEYSAGNPVTVWYVLATPETGIVNEPLMRVGDYVDTVSMTQSGMAIPTVAGSNILDMTSPVKPSSMSITGNIKPTGYGQLLDVNNVEIYDKNNIPVFITG